MRALSQDQQSIIQTNMNKSPSNQTEAHMQHELTRLTGENFDHKDGQVKRLKRQLKAYMKRMLQCGVMGGVRTAAQMLPGLPA